MFIHCTLNGKFCILLLTRSCSFTNTLKHNKGHQSRPVEGSFVCVTFLCTLICFINATCFYYLCVSYHKKRIEKTNFPISQRYIWISVVAQTQECISPLTFRLTPRGTFSSMWSLSYKFFIDKYFNSRDIF